MARLRAVDLKAVLDVVARLYQIDDPAELAKTIASEVTRLIGSDATGFTLVDLPAQTSAAVTDPPEWDLSALQPLLNLHMKDHPVIAHFFTNPADTSARAISDFATRGDFLDTGLYHDLYRAFGTQDQLTVALPAGGPSPSAQIGVSVGRNKWRFTRRDRALLEALRPHFAQAYQNALRAQALKRRLQAARGDWDALPFGLIRLDAAGGVLDISTPAVRMLRNHFPDTGPAATTTSLPHPLVDWVSAVLASPDATILPMTVDGDPRLMITATRAEGGLVIHLAEHAATIPGPASLRKAGLTPREADIARWLMEGKTNPEIGIILKISPRTVQKHLEHLFQKLRVETRTAAIARLLDLPR